jgi:hypothetical protein
MLNRTRAADPFRGMRPHFPFSEAGIAEAVGSTRTMRLVKAPVVPRLELTQQS